MNHAFDGTVVAMQPWLELTRSFDQRSGEYGGYVLCIDGEVDGLSVEGALVGANQQTMERLALGVGDSVSGSAPALGYLDVEDDAVVVEVTELRVVARDTAPDESPPPWRMRPPPIHVYEERGFRRLDAGLYDLQCWSCTWGCRAQVEMIIDHWNPSVREHRAETFCYGPLSCRLYQAGPKRQVPGRKGMRYTEEDWVDGDATRHREDEEE